MRLVMILVLVFGLFYLYMSGRPKPKVEIPPPPPALSLEPLPTLSEAELEKIRGSTRDSNPTVRWAAIEFLYRVRDPKAMEILESVLAMDTETAVRKNALDLLRRAQKPTAIKEVLLALRDREKELRIAALLALGEIGDRSLVPQVSPLLNDIDFEVRLQAMHTMNRFQEQHNAKHNALVQELRKQYEAAVRKAQGQDAPYMPKTYY